MPDLLINIFISYAHTDSALADRLEADLRQQGFNTWLDRRGLAGGQQWRKELQEAVDRSDVVLVVLSPEAVASQYVQTEYGYAADEGKLVIPLYYRPCKVPMGLRAIQWIDFQHNYEQGLAALLHALHRQRSMNTPLASSADYRPNILGQQPSQNERGEAGQVIHSNLPAQPTRLIGRQHEIELACALLRQPDVRLVTLTGIAGIGKTRLGLQVAAQLSPQFSDGVFLVPLAPVTDPEQVVPAILQALSISDSSSQPSLDRLKTLLKEKQVLLLLDNFEQVIDAAIVVVDLLAACPSLKILVTSRVVLHLRGEHEFVVPPLSIPNPKRLPDLATLSHYDAVALFIARAQAVKPEFELTAANAAAVARICARLDGLPLAIELAAARTKYFSPQTLLSRLEQGLAVLSGGARDLPARQQTLRGAIAWSYNLLTPEEQRLFRQLAVFVDGFTCQAAEQVCTAATVLPGDILEGLVSLVDKSLLRQEEQVKDAGGEEAEPRFWMLQTLREFGLEWLAGAGETEVTRQAQADYYLTLSEEAEPHLRTVGQASWFARLEQEHENMRAALNWLLEQARVAGGTEERKQQALRMCIALEPFWYIRGYVQEGLTFLGQALAVGEDVSASVKARVLCAAADLAFTVEDLERSEMLSRESLELFRNLGDKMGMADSLFNLGSVTWARSRYALARPEMEEAAALFQEMGENWKRGRCLTQLARISTVQGEYDRAHILLEESLEFYRVSGDKERISWVLYLLARLLFLSQKDSTQARSLTDQSLALAQEIGDPWARAYPLVLLGQITLQRGEPVRARELFEESVTLFKEVGDRGGTADAFMGLANVATMQGDLVAAHALYEESLAIAREADYKEDMAPGLEALAAVGAKQGKSRMAVRLWGAAEALREAIGAPIPPVERADYEQAVATARSQLSEDAFAAAWAEGHALPLERLLDELLKSTRTVHPSYK